MEWWWWWRKGVEKKVIFNLSFIDDILSFLWHEKVFFSSFVGKCLVIYFMTRTPSLISSFILFVHLMVSSLLFLLIFKPKNGSNSIKFHLMNFISFIIIRWTKWKQKQKFLSLCTGMSKKRSLLASKSNSFRLCDVLGHLSVSFLSLLPLCHKDGKRKKKKPERERKMPNDSFHFHIMLWMRRSMKKLWQNNSWA